MPDNTIKVLLNHSICADLPVLPELGFTRVKATYLNPPAYQPQFFETLPTIWATPHLFQLAVEHEDATAIAEWVTLLLLHSYGVLHIRDFPKETLERAYDRDLWPALNGNYPDPRPNSLHALQLLSTANGVVVGAVFPRVIFFPGRDRSGWSQDDNLEPYLDSNRQRLDWSRARDLLLPSQYEQQRFFNRLHSIADKLDGTIKTALLNFCAREFRSFARSELPEALADNPATWPLLGDHHHEQDLLGSYPYKQQRNNGMTYYLLTDLPPADWMKSPIKPGLPAPNQYERVSNTQIRVRGGQPQIFDLGEHDRIVLLKDLFLDSAHYCAFNRQAAAQVEQIRRLHKPEITNNTGAFSEVKQSDLAVCFAPVKSELTAHFPAVLAEPEKFLAVRGRTADGGLIWEFNLVGQKLLWPTKPTFAKALPAASLFVWPPKVSQQWQLYVAHGVGAKRESCGRWHLIGEQGQLGDNFDLANDEYLNILNTPGQPNRPMALTLYDDSGKERGLLFLVPLDDDKSSHSAAASLAIDFGTSNTSLAYKLEDNKPAPLIFNESLSPKVLWGLAPQLENPGFVPFKWGGSKGYFPTILLERQIPPPAKKPDDQHSAGPQKTMLLDGMRVNNLEAQHLFAVDIPGLHAAMETRIFDGTLNFVWPEIHKNLKWEPDPRMPWRRPAFLGLALLYAHAELFFHHGARISDYVFTYPLAFSTTEDEGFRDETQALVNRLRYLCWGASEQVEPSYLDESRAIAKSVTAIGNKAVLEVFVDIGGGTTDIAIRHDGSFVLLDSIKLAGRSFFSAAEQNFDTTLDVSGSQEFKQHLSRLLLDHDSAEQMQKAVNNVRNRRIDFGSFYSLLINRLDDRKFRDKETIILDKGMGARSYQLYRTKLFFRHVLAYALLQAAAVVADKQLDPRTLTSGIRLILSGNGWGLMLFAELERSKAKLKEECQRILAILKHRLLQSYDEEIAAAPETRRVQLTRERECLENIKIADIDLLNERNLSKAKTDVTVGALTNVQQRRAQQEDTRPAPYTGVTLREVSINGAEQTMIRWCERWSEAELKKKAGPFVDEIESVEIGAPASYEVPLDQALAVFTALGAGGNNDPMPPEEWQKMNDLLLSGDVYLVDRRLARSPINQFISRVLYPEDARHQFLDILAMINKTLK